jgi:hypothetical protein
MARLAREFEVQHWQQNVVGFFTGTAASRLPAMLKLLCACGCGQVVGEWGITKFTQPAADEGLFVKNHHTRLLHRTYKVDARTGCWVWQGSLHPKTGYPNRVSRNGRRIAPMRFEYERRFGPIPDGLVPDHLCRNRTCVNPEHLQPVTPTVNGERALRARRIGGPPAGMRSLWPKTEEKLRVRRVRRGIGGFQTVEGQ